MKASHALRGSLIAAALTAALSASAEVRYTFKADLNGLDVSILTPDFVTSTGLFEPPQVTGGRTGNLATSVYFSVPGDATFGLTIAYELGGGDAFGLGSAVWLSTPGTYSMDFFGPATFTTQVVPESGSIAALGLGAFGLLKRRKKA